MQAHLLLASQTSHFTEFWTTAQGVDNTREMPNTLTGHNCLMFLKNRKCVMN
jgi:hypothetical protein